ncbi:MAG: hypothetical protein HC883_06170 [Bdellovibrionaceae bacterium]|nr:hypothetical protein [Pseudobdellovibrionaceae bacterium]
MDAEAQLSLVLKHIDHALLGVDVQVISEPTTANIARWILVELQKLSSDWREVRLERGDGLVCRVYGQAELGAVADPPDFVNG